MKSKDNKISLFQKVRDWKAIRGIGNNGLSLDKRLQSQFQRVQQEITEVHEAIVNEDWEEFQDAIGDSIVTLINIADIAGYDAEDCLKKAFDVIYLRKGLVSKTGDFVRYGKLNKELQEICDELQGNSGSEYFLEEDIEQFGPNNFKSE